MDLFGGQMNDEEDTAPLHFARSPLVPTAWAVRCPGCEELIEVADTDIGDPHGSTYMVDASTGAPWIRCEDCGTLIEVVGVTVEKNIPTAGINWG